MEDIASEVAMSRPNVYRHFADRDALLVELISRHSRALIDRAHKFISRHANFQDQIVEGLIFIADHGRRDPLTRYLINPDGTSLGQRMTASRTSETLAAEFWDPFLDHAYANKDLSAEVPRSDLYMWMGDLGLMLMRGLDSGDSSVERYRSLLTQFVAPAFTRTSAPATS